ncbi:hypothetical protein R1flu_018162 [Riccia fluitans]|uniref:Uncharacterized protein n=1 Tax=Riccia fluitans TaxID=41844 RepID=A0ABD1ZIH0_9MARC
MNGRSHERGKAKSSETVGRHTWQETCVRDEEGRNGEERITRKGPTEEISNDERRRNGRRTRREAAAAGRESPKCPYANADGFETIKKFDVNPSGVEGGAATYDTIPLYLSGEARCLAVMCSIYRH